MRHTIPRLHWKWRHSVKMLTVARQPQTQASILRPHPADSARAADLVVAASARIYTHIRTYVLVHSYTSIHICMYTSTYTYTQARSLICSLTCSHIHRRIQTSNILLMMRQRLMTSCSCTKREKHHASHCGDSVTSITPGVRMSGGHCHQQHHCRPHGDDTVATLGGCLVWFVVVYTRPRR